MNTTLGKHTQAAETLAQSSGHFAPRLFNQDAADPIAPLYRTVTSPAAARFIVTPVMEAVRIVPQIQSDEANKE